MIEGEMNEVSEEEMLEGIKEAHKAIQKLCDFQEVLRNEYGVEKREFEPKEANQSLEELLAGKVGSRMTDIVATGDRKSTRLNSSHVASSYAVFCLKKKINTG